MKRQRFPNSTTHRLIATLGICGTTILFLGCRGSVPSKNSDPGPGLSAILLRGRFVLPSGEIRSGSIDLNLESESRKYRIGIAPNETNLYVIEPGTYHVAPTRGWFGGINEDLIVDFNGHRYQVPFPRELLAHKGIVVKPKEIVSIGILESRLNLVPVNSHPELTVILINDVQTRRQLVQQMIQKIMDVKISQELRDNAANWSMALDQALVDLQEAKDATPITQPHTP